MVTEPCACGCGELITHRTFYPSEIPIRGTKRYKRGHQLRGLSPSQETRQKIARFGNCNAHWKGGRMTDERGYIFIKCPNHPFRDNCNYVREQRLVMERALGRYLQPNEIVHHLNHNPSDNRIENLMLMSPSKHTSLHHTGMKYNHKIKLCETP